MSNKEIRYFDTNYEVRKTDDDKLIVEGYAAVFDSESRDLGGFTEVIKRGAFAKTLAGGYDFKAFLNHDSTRTLGRMKNNTLELVEDEIGLRAKITLPNSQFGRDLAEEISSGYLDKMSFGFRVKEEEWETRNDDMLRVLTAVDLFEVSVVSEPAYLDTSVAKRHYEDAVKDANTSPFNLDYWKRKLKLLKHKNL